MFKTFRAAAFIIAVLACIGAADPRLSLGGIGIGDSVLDVVKQFGLPDTVQTTDFGQFWQWMDKDGLDREVIAGDDMMVRSVLIAPARLASTAQPSEMPLLHATLDEARKTIGTEGGIALPGWKEKPDVQVWSLGSGYLIAQATNDSIGSLRVLDVTTARTWGFATPPLVSPAHTAPVLVKQVLPPWLPPGAGTVIVRVLIDAAGKVADASVLIGSGDSYVDRFEIESMRASIFKPATCAGAPCPGVYLDDGGLSR